MRQLPNDLNMQVRSEMAKSVGQRRQNAAANPDGASAAQLRRFRRIEMFKLLGFIVGPTILIIIVLLILASFIK